MSVTVDDLMDWVGGSYQDQQLLEKCLAQAALLVNEYKGDTFVPDPVLDHCFLQVGSELFNRRSAPSGITQFSSFDGAPIRVARDPMQSVYPILLRYVEAGV
jgi:hypothetical protein